MKFGRSSYFAHNSLNFKPFALGPSLQILPETSQKPPIILPEIEKTNPLPISPRWDLSGRIMGGLWEVLERSSQIETIDYQCIIYKNGRIPLFSVFEYHLAVVCHQSQYLFNEFAVFLRKLPNIFGFLLSLYYLCKR